MVVSVDWKAKDSINKATNIIDDVSTTFIFNNFKILSVDYNYLYRTREKTSSRNGTANHSTVKTGIDEDTPRFSVVEVQAGSNRHRGFCATSTY